MISGSNILPSTWSYSWAPLSAVCLTELLNAKLSAWLHFRISISLLTHSVLSIYLNFLSCFYATSLKSLIIFFFKLVFWTRCLVSHLFQYLWVWLLPREEHLEQPGVLIFHSRYWIVYIGSPGFSSVLFGAFLCRFLLKTVSPLSSRVRLRVSPLCWGVWIPLGRWSWRYSVAFYPLVPLKVSSWEVCIHGSGVGEGNLRLQPVVFAVFSWRPCCHCHQKGRQTCKTWTILQLKNCICLLGLLHSFSDIGFSNLKIIFLYFHGFVIFIWVLNISQRPMF